MNELMDFISSNFILFVLITVRVSGIFVAAPIFARGNIPMLLKIGLSATISFILLPILMDHYTIEIDGILSLSVYTITEFMIGLIIGFIAFVFFSVLYLAGTIIDTQMGFGMVNVFDPQTNTQIPVMGNFYNNLLSLLFIIVNGHHLLIRALVHSYNILPVGVTFNVNIYAIDLATAIMSEVFMLAFKFSAPVLLTIFLGNVVLGILARTMPQMNVFIVGLPLKIVIGMLTVIITLQYFIPFSDRLFDRMITAIYEMMQILARG
ncbi:flagellar biosynthetic protein FliR [Alkaliphilus peptidifermentans]|uniref:Flagellar biosynthetic protein FliR n=1 Tax=Alkaliphilus peptidifermentans DSM 18978 TaxID=1120976 RepID=A0A1G5DGN2_9FIRM|nr:flagellar biosynthetic protein FliR [Alkaliphilus peptidifermentans]SCY13701.1 flagellar biosynthetic protein FliR [Alkaliphilus peptidifermentans DSM 18978]